jgi:hypothetical protein
MPEREREKERERERENFKSSKSKDPILSYNTRKDNPEQ